MADYDDIVIINEGYEIRKDRVVITVTAEPIAVNCDPVSLGAGPAKAIAFHLAERVRGLTATAAAATLEYRRKAAKAFAAGAPWAQKRYAGGRMGAKPPNQSDRAFNDSGRLADSIVARGSSDGKWRVNVAANRFKSDTSRGFEFIWAKLTSLIPEFGNPAELLNQELVKASIAKAQRDMVTKMKATSKNTGIDVALAAMRLAGAIVDLGVEAAAG